MRRLWSFAAIFLFAASAFAADPAKTPVVRPALAAAVAGATTPPLSNQYQHIKNVWNAPNSTYPDCSATVTLGCLDTYTFTAVGPAGGNNIITVANGAIPAGGLVTYIYGPGSFLYCGTWSTSVTANYRDDSGASVQSTPATATVNVPCPLVASPATNLISTPAL